MLTLVKTKVRRKFKWPKPPLLDLLFYGLLVVQLLWMLTSEKNHPSSFSPLQWFVVQCMLNVVISLLLWMTGLSLYKALRDMFFHPFMVIVLTLYLVTFVSTLILHFPFTVVLSW